MATQLRAIYHRISVSKAIAHEGYYIGEVDHVDNSRQRSTASRDSDEAGSCGHGHIIVSPTGLAHFGYTQSEDTLEVPPGLQQVLLDY